MPAVVLEMTRLSYRGKHGAKLHDFSLAIRRGECVALLGPSGSGKTTLMRLVAGFAKATDGLVIHGGKLIDAVPPHRRGFGIVQQPDALFPQLDLAANVALPLRLQRRRLGGAPKADKALVDAALELVQLDHAATLLPGQATRAERQRTMLARAAVCGPTVLLLDDPFGQQDEAGRHVMRASIRQVHRTLGSATLIATADAANAMAVADRIAVLDRGRLVQISLPEELQDRPQTARVAGMLADTNLLDGKVVALEDDIATVKLACGPVAYARTSGTLAADTPCVLAIDPARIAVAPVAASDMGGWALDATLIEVQFLGDAFRIRLLLGSGAELVVRRAAGAGLRGLSPGRTVAVAWEPYHATAYPPDKLQEDFLPAQQWLPPALWQSLNDS